MRIIVLTNVRLKMSMETLIRPKWGHLKEVPEAIKLCEEALIATDPTITSLGPNLEV